MLGDPLLLEDSDDDSDREDRKWMHGKRIEELKHQSDADKEQSNNQFVFCFTMDAVLPLREQM